MEKKMGVVIKIIENGPALISGIIELPVVSLSHTDGRTKQTTISYAICRCGKSKNQPFCDGSHKQ